MSFTSIGVLTTCLVIVGVAYLITANVNSMVGYIESQSEMVVFLNQDVDEAKIESVRKEISSNQNISSIVYVSKEQGLENTKDMLGDSGHLLDGFEERNAIPASFNLKLKNLAQTRQTAEKLRQIDGVEIVQASDEVADTLTYFQKTINTFGTVLIAALAVISMVIIANTIRATIFARRKEINIMKYVGAKNSFIRIPFIVEGFLLGLISAVLAFTLVWVGYYYLTKPITEDISLWLQSAFDSIIPFKEIALNLALFFGVCGILIGTIGSAISIRNHAKV